MTASVDQGVKYWDMSTQPPSIGCSVNPSLNARSVAISPNGATIAYGTTNGTVFLVESGSCQLINQFDGHSGSVNSLSFNAKGDLLASGSSDNTVILWSLEPPINHTIFTEHQEPVRTVIFSPDSRLLLSGAEDGLLITYALPADSEAVNSINCR